MTPELLNAVESLRAIQCEVRRAIQNEVAMGRAADEAVAAHKAARAAVDDLMPKKRDAMDFLMNLLATTDTPLI